MPKATQTSTAGSSQGSIPKPRRRRSRPQPVMPLGSLTQVSTASSPSCAVCMSQRVTRLALQLADGTPVIFTSCHACEHRRWEHNGQEISVDAVKERAQKQ